MGRLLYALLLAGLVLGKLIRRPFELFPDGDAPGLGFIQHLSGVFRKTGRHRVGLSCLEEKQIFVRPGFIKGIVHIPLPGYPVKYLGRVHLDTAGGRAVGHELFHALFAVGRLGLPAGLGNLTANGPERIGKAPGRQLTGFHGNCDCTPGNIFVNQLYHLLALGQSVSKC